MHLPMRHFSSIGSVTLAIGLAMGAAFLAGGFSAELAESGPIPSDRGKRKCRGDRSANIHRGNDWTSAANGSFRHGYCRRSPVPLRDGACWREGLYLARLDPRPIGIEFFSENRRQRREGALPRFCRCRVSLATQNSSTRSRTVTSLRMRTVASMARRSRADKTIWGSPRRPRRRAGAWCRVSRPRRDHMAIQAGRVETCSPRRRRLCWR